MMQNITTSSRKCPDQMRNSLLLQAQLDSISGMAGRKRATQRKTPGWYLYILKCRDNTFYTGITTDLERRLDQHNNGTASRCTRSRLPVVRVYHEACANRSEALKRECAVKKLSRDEKDLMVKKRRTAAARKKTKTLDSR
jgi:putative endonuclease